MHPIQQWEQNITMETAQKHANYFVITLDCGATGFVGLTAAADVTGMICPVSDSMRAPMILPLSLFVGSTASTPSRIGMLPGAAKIRAQRKDKSMLCYTSQKAFSKFVTSEIL